MDHFIGLDISNKETSVCIIDENAKVIKQFKTQTDPSDIAKAIDKTGLTIRLIGLETGSLSHWLMEGLLEKKLPVKCIDSRRMAAIIQTNVNKTDRNDAKEIAKAMKSGHFREIHHKSNETVDAKVLANARTTLVEEITKLKNTIRGLLKTYGITIRKGLHDKNFIQDVEASLSWNDFVPEENKKIQYGFEAIRTLLSCIVKLSTEAKKLEDQLNAMYADNELVSRLTEIPGVGIITAISFINSIDDPSRFTYSRSVGAYFGLTPKQYSSGESTKQGRVSKCGNKETRRLLVSAGMSILTLSKKWSRFKSFGMKILRKTGCKKKAAVAIARKLAIIMFKMWIDGSDFIYGEPKKKNELLSEEKLGALYKKIDEKKGVKTIRMKIA